VSNKFRLRRWFFGKNRNNSLVRFVAKQCIKNIGHFNNEDRNHIRNGEFWLQNTLINHFSKNDKVPIVFDVGANIGEWSLNLLKSNSNIQLHCFEPSEKTFTILSEKLLSHSNVKINKLGLSKKAQIVDFFENDSPDVTSAYKRFNAENKEKVRVRLVKGDQYMAENKIKYIDFLKIDIEGMEYDALIGFLENLKSNTIQAIQFEYGEFNIHSEKMLKHFYELLTEYHIGKLYPNHIEFQGWHHDLENFKPANIVAINRQNKDLIKLFGA
jgi:FkbM family methyltransferase